VKRVWVAGKVGVERMWVDGSECRETVRGGLVVVVEGLNECTMRTQTSTTWSVWPHVVGMSPFKESRALGT
jgi:hypothetical protein